MHRKFRRTLRDDTSQGLWQSTEETVGSCVRRRAGADLRQRGRNLYPPLPRLDPVTSLPFVLTSINCDGSKVVNTFAMSDSDFRFVRCEQHIADLTLRIAELKDPSSAAGSGLIHSTEFLALLQQTLESWQQHERSLTT